MSVHTRPRALPVQHVRAGDEIAFAPGPHQQRIIEPEGATGWETWQKITRVDAGTRDGEVPFLLEFVDYPSLEFFHGETLVVREAAEVSA